MNKESTKIILFGADGMLGNTIKTFFNNNGWYVCPKTRTDFDIVKDGFGDLEISLYDSMKSLQRHNNYVVINCAGIIPHRGASNYEMIKVNAEFPHLLTKFKEKYVDMNMKIIHISTNCFVKNTLVYTSDGHKPIQDIRIGNFVYTHTGKLKKVYDVMTSVTKNIQKLKILGNGTIECTPNHLFYGIKHIAKDKVDYNKKEWIEAHDLAKNDLICVKKITKQFSTDEYYLDLSNLSKRQKYGIIFDKTIKDFENWDGGKMKFCRSYAENNNVPCSLIFNWLDGKHEPNEPNEPAILKKPIILNEEIAWMLGMFLAEGAVADRLYDSSIYFSFNSDEQYFMDRILNIFKDNFNLFGHVQYLTNQKGILLRFNSSELSLFLKNNFYDGINHKSCNKIIPTFMDCCKEKIVIAFLQGYFDGDSCFKNCIERNHWSVQSCSKQLITKVREYLLILGLLPYYGIRKPLNKFQNRVINANYSYYLNISGKQMSRFLDLFENPKISNNTSSKKRYEKFFEDEEYFYTPVIDNKIEYTDSQVYNLEVEDDHSYLVEGFLCSHNCVFGGKEEDRFQGYTEEDIPDPKDVYGMTKFLGEPKDEMVLRTSIIGEERKNKLGLLEWAKSQKGQIVTGYDDFWNGVTTLQLAKYLQHVIANNQFWTGIRHYFTNVMKYCVFDCDEYLYKPIITKYSLLKLISDVYELDLEVRPVMDLRKRGTKKHLNSIYHDHLTITPNFKEQLQELKEFHINE